MATAIDSTAAVNRQQQAWTATYTRAFKYDHQTDAFSEHLWGEGCYGGEIQFVPCPSGEEDEGCFELQ